MIDKKNIGASQASGTVTYEVRDKNGNVKSKVTEPVTIDLNSQENGSS